MRGKRERKRNYTPFITGMVTMALLTGLVSSYLAAKDSPSGGAEPAQIGVGLFLRQQIAPGEMLTTEKGGKAPKVLTCDDTKGETHYYIEATAVAELFDVHQGVNFHEEASQLEFAAAAHTNMDGEEVWDMFHSQERTDFHIVQTVDSNGDPLYIGGDNVSFVSGGGSAIVTGGSDPSAFLEPEELEEFWARVRDGLDETPEYGRSYGMYTEVDPAEINLGSLSGTDMQGTEFKDDREIRHTLRFTPLLGKYAAITVENTGALDARVSVARIYTVGNNEEPFSTVCLPAGGKITRAFRIDENKSLENQLELVVRPLGEGGVSVKLTNEQYRSGK